MTKELCFKLFLKAKSDISKQTGMPLDKININHDLEVGSGHANRNHGIKVGYKDFLYKTHISEKDMVAFLMTLFHEEGHILQFKEFENLPYNCLNDEIKYRMQYNIIFDFMPEYDILHYLHSPLETNAELNAIRHTKIFLETNKHLLPKNFDIDQEICNCINGYPQWYGKQPVISINDAMNKLENNCQLYKTVHIKYPTSKEAIEIIDKELKLRQATPQLDITKYHNFFHAWQNLGLHDEERGREMLINLIMQTYDCKSIYEHYRVSGILQPEDYKTSPIFQQTIEQSSSHRSIRKIDDDLLRLLDNEPVYDNEYQFE